MAKVNITKPTGSIENLNVISAFKADNNIYVVLDSEKMGSMGLPIIYVSKYTTKLEKINDANEWQNVKNYLKGIISGTNFEYVKIGDNLSADEAYYTPLTLPSASFDAIKTRYVVTEMDSSTTATVTSAPTTQTAPDSVAPVMPNTTTPSNATVNVTPVTGAETQPASPAEESVMNLIDNAYKTPAATPTQEVPPAPAVAPTQAPSITPQSSPASMTKAVEQPKEEPKNVSVTPSMSFDNDKETFLKACENMFDALISKYQKELTALEEKEQELAKKEAEINARLASANEHLKNAEAKETVANIAHDNAQKVMDLSSFMPQNPNSNSTN